MTETSVLTPEQQERFLAQGHCILHGCFTREAAEELKADAWRQLGYDPNDPNTWEKPLTFLFPSSHVSLKEFAPNAWEAVCTLLGGEDRISGSDPGVGQWVINFRRGADEPWQPPSPAVSGWHKDGNFFRHFLDSPEQGLLVIPLFSDVAHRGGGTFLAADSIPVVAKYLWDHPEGVRPNEFDYGALLSECRDFREVTGRVGDVALIHPFMLHNFSQNHSGRPRFITNLCIGLKEPMRFHRPDPSEFSLVERAVLRGLGVDRLEFSPAAPRERIDPKAMK